MVQISQNQQNSQKIFVIVLYRHNFTYEVPDVAKVKNALNFEHTYQITTLCSNTMQTSLISTLLLCSNLC
jgi:hypothetical protein